MRPTGSELKALKAVEELVTADHIAVSQKTGASSAYTDYLLRDLAKYNYVERVGKIYRLTEEGRRLLHEKQQIQEKVQLLEGGITEWLEEGLGEMVISQGIENKLKMRALAELTAEKGILSREELRDHLATVTQRDWNSEVDSLLPAELAEGFKIHSEEEQIEGGLGWVVIAQTIENRLKIKAIVELMVGKGILSLEELADHTSTVIQRDWDEEANSLGAERVTQLLQMEAVKAPDGVYAKTTGSWGYEKEPEKKSTPQSPPPQVRLGQYPPEVRKSEIYGERKGGLTRLDKARISIGSTMAEMREGLKKAKEHQKYVEDTILHGETETPGDSPYKSSKDKKSRST